MYARIFRGLIAALILTGAGSALAVDAGPGALSRDLQQIAQSKQNFGGIEACDGVALQCKRACSGRGLTAAGEKACQAQCVVNRNACVAKVPAKKS